MSSECQILLKGDDEDIVIQSLTKEYLDESLKLLQNVFFMEETTAVACGFSNDPEAREEWGQICLDVAHEGVSIIAVDKKKNRVAAVAFNKIHRKTDDDECFYNKYLKIFKSQSAKDLIMFCKQTDNVVDLFEICGCNCYLELMFLATSPEYRGRKLASHVTVGTLALAKLLNYGDNKKQSLTGDELTNDPKPGAVVAIFTSDISQKLAPKFGFEEAGRVSYREATRNGKTYHELVGGKQEECLVFYKPC